MFRHQKSGRSSAKGTSHLYPKRNPWYSLSEAELTSGHMVLSARYMYWNKKNNFKKDLFLNNQPDALIIPILFCYKTLHVSGIFCAHHQEFSTVHSAMVSFMKVFDAVPWVPSWLRLEAVIRNLHETYQCRMYSRKLLMMNREGCSIHVEFYNRIKFG